MVTPRKCAFVAFSERRYLNNYLFDTLGKVGRYFFIYFIHTFTYTHTRELKINREWGQKHNGTHSSHRTANTSQVCINA